jgi:histone deacetylase 1/2
MTIDYSTDRKLKIIMVPYIQEMLDDLPNDMAGEAATPAATHLFQVNEDAEKLDEDEARLFHHNVAKLLFLCKRARPDIQTAVAFLCTCVRNPEIDDYKKLTRVMRFLRGTINDPLTLEADNLSLIKWWIDAAYAVHPDMKSHTNGTMTLGKGSPYSACTNQKLKGKSSTEAELVSDSDIMPQVLWARYLFLQAQGYTVSDSIVYQDNQSAMLLEKNGRGSSSKRTRHINIQYFFVADRIANGEVKVEYCPTGDMLADFFTKPLQGSTFRKFRNEIMNLKSDPSNTTIQDPRSVLDKVNTTNTTEIDTTGNISQTSVPSQHRRKNEEHHPGRSKRTSCDLLILK